MSLSWSETTVMLLAAVSTSPARAAASSQRSDSLLAVARERRAVHLPLSRFHTLTSTSTSRVAQPAPRAAPPPFFQAAIPEPPQPKFDAHWILRESTSDPRNQLSELSAIEMCAYDSRYAGRDPEKTSMLSRRLALSFAAT